MQSLAELDRWLDEHRFTADLDLPWYTVTVRRGSEEIAAAWGLVVTEAVAAAVRAVDRVQMQEGIRYALEPNQPRPLGFGELDQELAERELLLTITAGGERARYLAYATEWATGIPLAAFYGESWSAVVPDALVAGRRYSEEVTGQPTPVVPRRSPRGGKWKRTAPPEVQAERVALAREALEQHGTVFQVPGPRPPPLLPGSFQLSQAEAKSFVKEYRTVSAAARAAGVPRGTFRDWLTGGRKR